MQRWLLPSNLWMYGLDGRPQLPDADDDMVLDVALNGRADGLVTHNLADISAIASRFALTVLTPGQLLKRIRI